MRLPWRIPNYGPLIETSLTESEAAELQRLARDKRVLEIGAAFGYSTVLLAQVARFVVSVDPHDAHHSLNVLEGNLIDYTVSRRVQIKVGTSAEILPKLGGSFDFIFVDGDHTAAGLGYDLAEVQNLTRPGSALAFHDWGEDSCPDVRPTLEAWRAPDYIVDTLAVYHLA